MTRALMDSLLHPILKKVEAFIMGLGLALWAGMSPASRTPGFPQGPDARRPVPTARIGLCVGFRSFTASKEENMIWRKENMIRLRRSAVTAGALLLSGLLTGSAFAAAIYTTDKTGTIVNANTQYGTATDVYLSGGPQNLKASGLPDDTYYFQVTDPSGKVLLSTDNALCRQLKVTGGRVDGAGGLCPHLNGTFNPANGATPVQLAPFSPTPNAGTVYKAWMIPTSKATIGSDPKVLIFAQKDAKTDNFKIPAFTPPPPGSCAPSSSLSVLVKGTNVTSYVPKGSWVYGTTTGVSVVNVEGSSITPALIPTANVVNSCASNSITGTTVCTANNTDVYLLSGTTLGSTLTSVGTGHIDFSGGPCTNCGVAMDAIHNKAVLGLSVGGVGGFQFLDLGTSTFEPAFASKAPGGFEAEISEDPLLDPIRNLLLSASENNNYEIIDYTTSTTPLFYENLIIPKYPWYYADSSGEDCSTGIALAPYEFTTTSQVYIADLTQATFTAGLPGTWTTTGSQIQTLSESSLSAGASGLAVAQGPQHKGVVTGEFGGDAVTAIQLPTTSGSGTPAITDWVTCNIGSGFSNGFDPHTVTAYESPNSGHAIALLANGTATTVAVVDLTNMLDTTIVPRTVSGHACASGSLPATVVSFVSVP